MNFKKLFFMLTFVVLLATTAFAQTTWYVNATNGLDVGFTGQSASQPFATLAKAHAMAANGDKIMVAGDTYTENPNITKRLTYEGYVDPTTLHQKVIIRGNVTINPGAGFTVTIGVAGIPFQIGDAITAGQLNLTSGTLSTTTANLILNPAATTDPSGGVTTINVADGIISVAPNFGTVTNLNYTPTANRSTGFELPATVTGTFGLNAAGFRLTTDKAVTVNGVFTVTAGTLDLGADFTAKAAMTNNGTIIVHDKTFWYSPAAAGVYTPTFGTIISETANVIGSGYVKISGSRNITTVGASVLPNFTIPSNYTGVFTTGANIDVDGTFTLSASQPGAFSFGGAHTLDILGDFNRTDNTLGNFVPAIGTLQFSGNSNSVLRPGSQLTVYNLSVSKTVAKVTLGASIIVSNNFTIVTGDVDLSDYNVRMINAVAGTGGLFTNGGSYYSTTNNGFVTFEGQSGRLTGSGYFGNLLINLAAVVVGTNYVDTGSNIDFSGILHIEKGYFGPGNGFTFRFTNYFLTSSFPNPICKINTTAGNNARLTLDPENDGTNGVVGIISGVVTLDLYYFGTGNYVNYGATRGEWGTATTTELNNVTIATTGGNVVEGFNGASTINGKLTVNRGQTLNQLNAANVYTLSGDGINHAINGTVSTGILRITANNAYLNGGTAAADQSAINDLEIQTGTGEFFFSNNLKSLRHLTMTSGTATINLFSDAVPTTVTHTGNLTVLAGKLTYNMGNAGKTTGLGVAGTGTVSGGTLELGSRLPVQGAFTHSGDGVITLGSYNLVLADNYTHNNTATFTQGGTGKVSMTHAGAGAKLVTLTTPVTIPNFEVNATHATGAVQLQSNNLTISGALYLEDGTFDLNGLNLDLTGNTIVWDAVNAPVFNATAGNSTLNLLGTGGSPITILVDDDDATAKNNNPNFSTAANALNITVNNVGGSVTFADNQTGFDYLFTVDGLFTQTAGDVILGEDNSLELNGGFTRAAGTWTMGLGRLVFDFGGTFTTGTGFSVDNLEIQQTVANATNTAYTVAKNLILSGGTLNQNTAGNLNIGNEALITRDNNGALGAAPTFGSKVNLLYLGANSPQITGPEWPGTPTSLVQDVTVNKTNAADVVRIAGNRIVNRLLYLQKGNLDVDNKTLTLADQATYKLTSTGTMDLTDAAAVFTTTTYHLVYTGGGNMVTDGQGEFPATTTKILSLTINMDGAGTTVSLNGNKTLNAGLTITRGTLVLGNGANNYYTLSVKGDVTVATNGSFGAVAARGVAGTGRPTLAFIGTVQQNLTGTFTMPNGALTTADKDFDDITDIPPYNVTINNSSDGGVVCNGNFTMGFGGILNLTRGILNMGSNTLTLWHFDNNIQPVQGFTRNVAAGQWSHVVGKVKKFLDVTGALGTTPAIAMTRVEFPVGTTATSPAYYRPFSVQFNTLPTAGFDLTVAHYVANPGGTNGFQNGGIQDGTRRITNYPGFYWLVNSNLTLQPQVKYDVEARADGYLDYLTDDIQNVRFIRRYDTNIDNPWVLQGGLGYDNSSFDYLNTPTISNDDSPVIIVRQAEGAISTQGARFTFSQLNKPPVVSSPADVTIDENSPVTITWTVSDIDLLQNPVFTGVTWSATSPAVIPTAGDGTNGTYKFTPSTGTLIWTPNYNQAGVYSVTVTANDGAGATNSVVTDVVQITVNNVNRAPSFTATGAATQATASVKNGVTYSFTYKAIDDDGDALTYSYTVTPTPAGATNIAAALGTLTFTPTFDDAGKVFNFTITATDANGATATTTTDVTVTYAIAKGDVSGNGTVDASDAAEILKYVVGLVTFTQEQLYAADVNNDSQVGALDAAWILYYSVNGSWPVGKVSAAIGSIEAGKLQKEADGYLLPINLVNTSGVLSVYTELNVDANIEVLGISARTPQGWINSSKIENGKVTLAMAGLEPLNDGSVAYVKIRIKDKEASATIFGNANLNDGYNSALNSVTVREIPTDFVLSQNYPNPFNPTTTIKFAIPENANVQLDIYNMLGQKVKTLMNGMQDAGYYKVNWDGTNDLGSRVSSGIYIYRISAGKYNATMKMNLLK